MQLKWKVGHLHCPFIQIEVLCFAADCSLDLCGGEECASFNFEFAFPVTHKMNASFAFPEHLQEESLICVPLSPHFSSRGSGHWA